ncbi:MAG: response regulator transcription factor [Oscillospiraceae bacterium]|nr:response regulator transcription factor [Oscillospiraceae bacterium]
MTKILIVEDDKEINKLLCRYLSDCGYETVSVENGLDAVRVIRDDSSLSLVLLDLMLPYQSGDSVLSKVREFSQVPVIILSAKDTVRTKIDLIRIGADDYITKPFDLDELLVRIEAVLRRCSPSQTIENSTIEFKDIVIDKQNKSVTVCGNIITLTSKEYTILELMLENPTKLFSKANIFESVWGETYLGDDNAVKVHMSNLRSKIKKYSPDDEYIETIWGMGYKLKS